MAVDQVSETQEQFWKNLVLGVIEGIDPYYSLIRPNECHLCYSLVSY